MNSYQVINNELVFACGCTFKIEGSSVVFDADLYHPNHTVKFDCPLVYETLSDGQVEGVFQLCSPLGKQWCGKVKPSNLEHMSALGALLRPGCLQSKDEHGISTTIHYERRKTDKEDTPLYHPVVDEVLRDTFNCLIYQEQAMEIAKRCAGFSLQEADSLRKAIAKKIPEEMSKSKKLFMEKGLTFGVLTEEQLVEVFNWIEASQRYSFNRSHATSYGITGYMNQYIKVHFPAQYYKSWLQWEKKREIYSGMINEAKQFGITVNPPNIQHFKLEFYVKGKNVYFGLGNIKGCLVKDLDNLSKIITDQGWALEQIGHGIPWMKFMSVALYNISSRTADGLIHSGALDCFQLPRALMSLQYEYYCLLSDGERSRLAEELSLEELLSNTIKDYEERYKKSMSEWEEGPKTKKIKTLVEDGKKLIFTSVKKQKKAYTELKQQLIDSKVEFEEIEEEIDIFPPKPNQRLTTVREILHKLSHPLYNIVDTLDSVLFHEEDLLGVALTRHATDAIINAAQTHSCMDIVNGYKGRATLKVKIDQARPYNRKNGSQMCFLKVSDETSMLDVVCFGGKADDENSGYKAFKYLLTSGNIVFLSGQLSEKGSFVIERVYPVA